LNSTSASALEGAGSWICCQLGARDHYSVPRGLHRRGLLEGLITDAWISPTSPLARLPGEFGERLRARYDEALADATVLHSSASTIGYELRGSLTKSRNIWDSIIARNNRFQAKAIRHLLALTRHADQRSSHVVFAYSYAAREILKAARELGYATVLGQIDPGPAEDRIVTEIYRRRGDQTAERERVPESYWEAWREECDLCDDIIVNSRWTRNALIAEGVQAGKIHVVPVAYDPPERVGQLKRAYPTSFNNSRPMRVLFLGSLIPRKGIYEMLDATVSMTSAPVEFRFVGASGVELSRNAAENPNLHWIGPVARSKVHDFYSNADIFILPTHSDGFGLTQLEAMASGLPVIASKHCGDVVKHEVNGLILPAVTAEAIAEAIEWCINNPERLGPMSDCATRTSNEFRVDYVTSRLLRLRQRPPQPPEMADLAG